MNAQAIMIAYAALGGAFGAVLRAALSEKFNPARTGFAWGTFSANMLASIILGILTAYAGANGMSTNAEMLLNAGFCATLSTFSSLVWEITQMIKKRAYRLCAAYALSTFICGMLCFVAAEELCAKIFG